MKNGRYVKGELHKICLKQRFYEMETNQVKQGRKKAFILLLSTPNYFNNKKQRDKKQNKKVGFYTSWRGDL